MVTNTTQTAIVGLGETAFVRRSPRSAGEMAVEACRAAIADAGLDITQVDGIVMVNPDPAADEVAAAIGMRRRFTGSAGYAPGAGSLSAALIARLALQAGLADAVVVYLGYSSSAAGGPYLYHAEDPVKAAFEMPFGWYGQPVYFAAWAQRYRHEYKVTNEELASVAVAARTWARLTPGAQLTLPLDLNSYLDEPMIATPLRRADCCLLTDGAAAYVMTRADRARDLPHRPVVLAGAGVASLDMTMGSVFSQKADLLELGSRRSGPLAYADAGLGPQDMDLAMIYDCFSISMVIQLEELGFCPPGEGFRFLADGHGSPGGSIPINTNGGHLAYAYLPGVTMVTEAVRQLRGQRGDGQVAGAEVALVSALGGNDHASLVLTRDR